MKIFLVLILAAILRFTGLGQSLWLDEAISVTFAQKLDFWKFVTQYPIGDFHPPLYFAMLWIWGHLFGFSELSVRFPSVIFGVLTVFFTYLIGKELFSKKVGFLAAIFLSLAPLHIYYSQEARMYALAAFATTLSFYFLVRLFNKKPAFLGYSLSVAVVLYSDYLTYFVVPTQLIYTLFYYRSELRRYLFSLFLSFVSIYPWLAVFPVQFSIGVKTSFILAGWREIVGSADFKNLLLLPIKILIGRISFENKTLYALLLVVASIPYLVIFTRLRTTLTKEITLLLFWLIAPPIFAFLVSFYIPIFSYFRFIFILPALNLLISKLVNEFSPKTSRILITAILTVMITSSLTYLLNPKFHREDWRGAVTFVSGQIDDQGIVLFENPDVPAPFTYYQKSSIDTAGALRRIPAREEKDLSLEVIQGKKKIYLFEYLVDITDPQRLLEKKIQSLGFEKMQTFNFNGVGFIHQYGLK